MQELRDKLKEFFESPRGIQTKKIAKYVGLALAGLFVAGVVSVLLVVRHYESKLPNVHQLKTNYQPPQITRVLARDGTVLASLFTERRTVISFAEIPNHTKLAFLAAEDAGFYQHRGLNYFGMLRALFVNLRAGRTRQGASTITQQVVKNVLLDAERSYERKIKETILARQLETELTKDEIFSLYLNHIYLGHGRFGIEEAARYYFGKKARDLGLAESALLAGLIASPERYSPRNDLTKSLTRRRYVLDQMLEKSFVTREAYDQARDAQVLLAPAAEGESELAPEVVAYVRAELDKADPELSRRGGFTVETTIDPVMQAAARAAVRENLDKFATRHKLEPPFTVPNRKAWGPLFKGQPRQYLVYTGRVVALNDQASTIDVSVGNAVARVELSREDRYNPKHLRPSEFAKENAAMRVSFLTAPDATGKPTPARLELGPQSALVALDVRSREVLALVGSYEAIMGGLDRATNPRAHRQPGSAFKPILYSYALHSRRFTPASMLDLEKQVKGKPSGEPYRISVRAAITASDNAAAEKLLKDVGPPNVVEWAKALGVTSNLAPTKSLALGAYEVTPLELANVYVTFANGGEVERPKLIRRIIAPGGAIRPLAEVPPKRRVMTPDEAYLTTSLMRSVVEKGTGQRARALGRPVVGKTGTTNDAKDTWFVGYSTDIVTAVWVGYDDALPLGAAESGAVTALPAWVTFMKAAHDKRPPTEFPRPPSIIVASVDPATGLLAYSGQEDAVDEEFLEGTVPTDTAQPDAGAPEAGVPHEGEAALSNGTAEIPGSLPPAPTPETVPVSGNEPPDSGVEPPPF